MPIPVWVPVPVAASCARILFWSDPLGASTNDYDLYVLNSSGTTIIASSLNTQTAVRIQYESVGTIANGELIVIVKFFRGGKIFAPFQQAVGC